MTTQTKDLTAETLVRLLGSIVEELRGHRSLSPSGAYLEIGASDADSGWLRCGVGVELPRRPLADGSLSEGDAKSTTDLVVGALLAYAERTAEEKRSGLIRISDIRYVATPGETHVGFGIEYKQRAIVRAEDLAGVLHLAIVDYLRKNGTLEDHCVRGELRVASACVACERAERRLSLDLPAFDGPIMFETAERIGFAIRVGAAQEAAERGFTRVGIELLPIVVSEEAGVTSIRVVYVQAMAK